MMDTYQKERMLLGAIISEKSLIKLVDRLDEDCFESDANRAVYGEILRCKQQGKPIDPTYLAEKTTGVDAREFLKYMIDLSREGSVWHAEQYARDLILASRKRKLHRMYLDCARRLETEDMQAVMDDCREGMRRMSVAKGNVSTIGDAAMRMFDRLEAISHGELSEVKTGLPDLDEMLGGLSQGDIVIVGARPAVGKSTFGMSIALAAARQGKRTLVCSCEMSDVQYAQRVASEITGISSSDIKKARLNEQQWAALGDALEEMSRMGVVFTFDSNYVEDLYSTCVAEKDSRGLDLLVVDYIQIMDTKARCENDNIRITKISGKLKRLALELQIPVVVLAQVKRQEGSAMRMPTLQELRGSGSLEQDADKVIFLHRVESPSDPYCRSQEALRRFMDAGDQMIAVDVAKHRDGPCGSFCTRFEPRRMKYTCLTHRRD